MAELGKERLEAATIPTADVPAPRSFRLRQQDLDLLSRLQRRLAGRSQVDILSMALVHLWVSLERDERIHLVVPEEPREGK